MEIGSLVARNHGVYTASGRDWTNGYGAIMVYDPLGGLVRYGGVMVIHVRAPTTAGFPDVHWCSDGGTMIRALEAIEKFIPTTDDLHHAVIIAAALQFVAALKPYLTNRASRTLVRFWRSRAFRRTIRNRIRARIVLGKSFVFCDLPRDMVRVFGEQWL